MDGKFILRVFRLTANPASPNPVHMSRFRKKLPPGVVISKGSTTMGKDRRSCSLHCRRRMLFRQRSINRSTAKKPVQISTG
jgi:hypothetical protein